MKFLLIEDDVRLAQTVKKNLVSENNIVETAENGADGSFLGRTFDYDAIILDNSLPKKDGLTVCQEIRSSNKSTPIIFLTVDGAIETKMLAFERGADDYIQKPFSLQELSARLRAVTRRPSKFKQAILRIHDLELDTEKQTVTRGGRKLHPTRKEFSLLEYFMKNIGVVISRSILMEHVWTADSNPFSNTVEAHIRNLRLKLNVGNKPNLIVNVSGRGYVMDTPENLRKM
jgi:DNA-binding response OmpR family regulator